MADEWRKGDFVILSSDEDIHTANERRLGEIIGKNIAGKLHTGRSRNDQVATDSKLWMRSALKDVGMELKRLLSSMVDQSRQHLDVIMPGFVVCRVSEWFYMLRQRTRRRWNSACSRGKFMVPSTSFLL